MYTKITEGTPEPDTEVLCYNGETEYKNIYDGEDWKYKMRYPVTHWMPLPKRPSFQEVIEVREAIAVT